MKKLVFAFLLALLPSAGCVDADRKHAENEASKRPVPTFHGALPDGPIDWDLSGTWRAWRFQDKNGKSKLGRWEATWRLERLSLESGVGWSYRDGNGQGTFQLQTSPADRRAQVLVWTRPDGRRLCLSVNKSSFGFLRHMTGDDGELYSAVRSD